MTDPMAHQRTSQQLTPLITAAQIQQRVDQLGQQLTEDYRDKPLTLLGVLTGSLMFLTDISRRIQTPHRVGLLQASSYRGETTISGELVINLDLLPELEGRDVLLVDDILDTGQTMSRLVETLCRHNPNSIQTAVLLWKQVRTTHPIEPNHYGFKIEDHFVVGYGLDYNDDYRHLPDVCKLALSNG